MACCIQKCTIPGCKQSWRNLILSKASLKTKEAPFMNVKCQIKNNDSTIIEVIFLKVYVNSLYLRVINTPKILYFDLFGFGM